jgi:hypothetical protein
MRAVTLDDWRGIAQSRDTTNPSSIRSAHGLFLAALLLATAFILGCSGDPPYPPVPRAAASPQGCTFCECA